MSDTTKYSEKITRGEDGLYVAECPEFPGCITQGETEEIARENLREAIDLCNDAKLLDEHDTYVRMRWVTDDGRHLLPEEMDTDHVRNALAFVCGRLEKARYYEQERDYYEHWATRFEAELQRRGEPVS